MDSLKGHYWLLVLADGKDDVRRVYVSKVELEESSDDAVERWVEGELGDRQRNRARVAANLRASILYTRDTRPSSWHRTNPKTAEPTTARRTRRKS